MDTKLAENIKSLTSLLKEKRNTQLNMLIGVDGFVDEIIHVVDKRIDFNTFTRVEKIENLGNRILKAAGLSTNIEFVPVQTKLGGNGPIFANALIEYGVGLTYAGAIGVPDIHQVFKKMAENSIAVYPMCEPGHTDALEFDDGKLLLGKTSSLNQITWARFKEVIGGLDKVVDLINTSSLFGMENWTMVPHMSELWEGIISDVFPLLPDRAEKPLAFFDLADPEKRSKADILHAMKLIGKFEQKFRAILGLNEKELFEIAEVFEIEMHNMLNQEEKLKYTTLKVYEKLNIYCLVVHPTKEAAAVVDNTYYHTYGPYCQKPVLTTGAGDNFNAGFCFGSALGIPTQYALLLGVATSGFYVRNAKSPTYDDVLNFLIDWENEKI